MKLLKLKFNFGKRLYGIEWNSMSDELVLMDSNILSYVFDESEPQKCKICGELVADCWKKNT